MGSDRRPRDSRARSIRRNTGRSKRTANPEFNAVPAAVGSAPGRSFVQCPHPAMRNMVIVATVALLVRLWLILAFPIVYGGDSLLRLINRDHILISYQLPLLQLLIWALTRFFTSVLSVRLLMAALGAFAAVAFYRFASDFVSERGALAGALLFATNPFITAVSSVPYQEILLLGCLLL